jgi:hypothetical protein
MGVLAEGIYYYPDSAALMKTFCVSVGLTLVQQARKDGHCAIHGLDQQFRSSNERVASVRTCLGDTIERNFLHTPLYQFTDEYKGKASLVGPALLRQAAAALRAGAWVGGPGLQAAARMLGQPIMVIRETSEKHIGGFLLRACRPTFAFCRHCPHRVPTVYSFPSPQRDRAHNVPKLVCAQKYADFVRRRTNISAHERLMRRDVVHQTLPRTDQCTFFLFF